MTITFDEQVALVTGAGNGLGRQYALELARRGAKVVVNDLGGATDGTGSGSAAEVVVAEIVAAGGEAVASGQSVTSAEGGAAIVQTALDAYGRLDIVINNAGILRDASFVKLQQANLDAVLDVHLRAAFFVTQPAFRHMREQGYGRLLFTTSAAGLFGNFGQSNYGAAKMGLVGLSNVLAVEGAGRGITSNVIAPGARTRMTEELLGPLADALGPNLITPMALYLVSRECEITHEVYSAIGGRYARVFVGLTPGWFAGVGIEPSVDDIADHIDAIRNEAGYVVPSDISAEMSTIVELLTAGAS
jgi:NAD(P)-dependent dehydrogenase (short-subunit alcohol dehydrogenase family)